MCWSCICTRSCVQTDRYKWSLEDLCSSLESLHLICQHQSRNEPSEQFVCLTACRRTTGRSVSNCCNKSARRNQANNTHASVQCSLMKFCSNSVISHFVAVRASPNGNMSGVGLITWAHDKSKARALCSGFVSSHLMTLTTRHSLPTCCQTSWHVIFVTGWQLFCL